MIVLECRDVDHHSDHVEITVADKFLACSDASSHADSHATVRSSPKVPGWREPNSTHVQRFHCGPCRGTGAEAHYEGMDAMQLSKRLVERHSQRLTARTKSNERIVLSLKRPEKCGVVLVTAGLMGDPKPNYLRAEFRQDEG